jgi:hypothetical protein
MKLTALSSECVDIHLQNRLKTQTKGATDFTDFAQIGLKIIHMLVDYSGPVFASDVAALCRTRCCAGHGNEGWFKITGKGCSGMRSTDQAIECCGENRFWTERDAAILNSPSLSTLLNSLLFSFLRKRPPRKSFTPFHKMNDRHKHINHARVLLFACCRA